MDKIPTMSSTLEQLLWRLIFCKKNPGICRFLLKNINYYDTALWKWTMKFSIIFFITVQDIVDLT